MHATRRLRTALKWSALGATGGVVAGALVHQSIQPSMSRRRHGVPGASGAMDGFTLAAFEPERFLILDWKAPNGVRLVSWAFVLEPLNDGSIRRIVRARGGSGYRFFRLPQSITKRIVPVVHAVHFMMQRKQLLGIAKQAESRTAP